MTVGFSLETERTILTPWDGDEADLAGFRALATDPEIVRYISYGVPLEEGKIREFVARQVRSYRERGFCLWRLTLKGHHGLDGFCGIQPFVHGSEVELGWWLAREFWGRGIATEAARAAFHDAFTRVGLDRVIAAAMPDHGASIAIMRKLGMTYAREDVHRDGVKCVVYELSRPVEIAAEAHSAPR